MSLRSLLHLLEPESILWLGPTGDAPPWVAIAEANLWDAGFAGTILAARSAGRAPAEARVADLAALEVLPRLAVICLPQDDLPDLLRSLSGRGCRAASLIGGGTGRAALPPDAMAKVRAATVQSGLRLIGPDRIGVIVPSHRLVTGTAPLPPVGDLAFVAQSDTIAATLLDWAAARGEGFSHLVSLGESTEGELGDVLDYLALQTSARAILIHLEGIADARRFMSAARAAARMKPVLVLKAGRQLAPAAAGAGDVGIRLHRDQVYDAAFARAGIVRVSSIEELFAAAASLGVRGYRRTPGLRNGRLALLTNGHGPAELAADTLLAGGGQLVRPGAKLVAEVARSVGEVASLASAIDLGPDADAAAYGAALDLLLHTPDIDGVVVLHGRSAGVDPAAVADAVAAVAAKSVFGAVRRPVFAAWLGDIALAAARASFERAAIPAFATPESAVRAFLYRVQHERRQFLLRQVPASRDEARREGDGRAGDVLAAALRQLRRSLTEAEAMALLDAYGIASVPTRLAPDLEAAAAAGAELGYPLALKIVAPHLPQKSSLGGVALDIIDEASLMRRGRHMLEQVRAAVPGTPIDGFLVQRMERSLAPLELYLGVETDPTFGPILLLGHAALRATATAIVYFLPPLDSALAHAMLDETPLGRFLAHQDADGAVLEGIVETLVRLSELVVEQPLVRRLALDPLLVNAGRQVVLDAHVELAQPWRERRTLLAVRPYPRRLEQTASLRDGREIRLRPIRPDDAPRLQQLFNGLTPEDRRRRLFSSISEMSDELAARMTQIDYDREMVLVALDPDDPDTIWGGARIAADADNRRAEYSVTVRSDRQGLGLGRICFERVLDYARSRGIEEVWGTVLAENDGMLGLAQRLGFTRRRDPDSPDLFITEKRLAPDPAAEPPALER